MSSLLRDQYFFFHLLAACMDLVHQMEDSILDV